MNDRNLFAYAASDINKQRSQFPISTSVTTTMSAGLLYPIFCMETLPGDTVDYDVSSFLRMLTPIHPVMDNAYVDVMWFHVPNRLVYENWEEFMGEVGSDPYISKVERRLPKLVPYSQDEFDSMSDYTYNDNRIIPHSVADYLDVPLGTPDFLNALRFRGFSLIWNQWFRDQNLQNAINIPLGDITEHYANPCNTPVYFWNDALQQVEYTNVDMINPNGGLVNYNNIIRPYDAGDSYVHTCAYGGCLPPVNKFHDYFTSCLLSPERSDNPVAIPLSGFSPVYAISGINNNALSNDEVYVSRTDENGPSRMVIGEYNGTLAADVSSDWETSPSGRFTNLVTDLSNVFSKGTNAYATINDLRFAFATSALLTNDSVFGGRYVEQIKAHFGVDAPSGLIQRSEYLGGNRFRIGMSQIAQTSSTDNTSPQGNMAAYSLTTDTSTRFIKSFSEHGYIFCVACIRTDHTYSQGIPKDLTRLDRFDFYFPEFANIAEQPVYTRQIYIPDLYDENFAYDEIFGYQEPWQEYRQYPRRLTGSMRPNYARSLSVWHYGDDYSNAPSLSDEWIRETRVNIDRTLAVSSHLEDQFLCDFTCSGKKVCTLPVRSRIGTHL